MKYPTTKSDKKYERNKQNRHKNPKLKKVTYRGDINERLMIVNS